jgi:hypothetical protein
VVDMGTFLTTLYAIVNDFWHSRPPKSSALVLSHPPLEAKCLTWPSLRVGAVSTARGDSTAMQTSNCAMLPFASVFTSPPALAVESMSRVVTLFSPAGLAGKRPSPLALRPWPRSNVGS